MASYRNKISIDTVLLALASVTFCVAVYKLVADNSNDLSARDGYSALGHVRDSNNDVRRRLPRAFTWNPLPSGDAVYDGDTIFTGDESGATVQLDIGGAGGVINLGPRTLVVLHKENQGHTIELRYGEAEGKGSNIAVSVKEGPVTKKILEGTGTFNATKKKGDSARVKALTEGFALHGTNQAVKANQTVKVQKESGVSVSSGEIIPVTPGTGTPIWYSPGDKISLEWKTNGGVPAKDFVVELSRESDFKKVLISSKAQNPKTALDTSELRPGPLYWRVRSAADKSVLSQVSSMVLYPDTVPQLVAPQANERVTYDPELKETGKGVNLQWTDQSGSREYAVEIARDDKFTNIVQTQIASTQSLLTSTLSEGVYHWRVQGKHPARTTAKWSAPSVFEVRSNLVVPVAPQIPAQTLNYQIPQSVINRLPASLPPGAPGVEPVNLPPIKWAPVANATSYEIEVANDERFTKTTNITTSEPSWTPTKVKPGALFMRVKAKGRAGVVSLPSAPSRLNIEMPPPEAAPLKSVGKKFESEVGLMKARQEFKFSWTPRPWASGYELEIARDKDFKTKKSLLVREPQKALSVAEPGDYHYRVRAVDENGTPLSPFSTPKSVAYKKVLDIPKPVPLMTIAEPADVKVAGQIIRSVKPPELIEPRRRTNVISLDDTPTYVTFRWKPVKGATQYLLQISKDHSFANILSEVKLRDTDFVFEDRLPVGNVFWRVRAEKAAKGRTPASDSDISEWSPTSDLNILHGK